MFILASSSPTRITLLKNAGLKFTAIKPEVDENSLHQKYEHLPPRQFTLKLAAEKALSVSLKRSALMVVGVDQTLHLGQTIFHKPKNIDEARFILKKLRGQVHHLTTAIACYVDQNQIWHGQTETKMTMRSYSDAFLDQYLMQNVTAALSSAGAYQIEAHGIQLFDKIEGDYFAILGFPLIEFLTFLRTKGILES